MMVPGIVLEMLMERTVPGDGLHSGVRERELSRMAPRFSVGRTTKRIRSPGERMSSIR